MILLFITFLIIFFFLYKDKSVAFILIIVQLLSITGTFFLGRKLDIETGEDYGWIFLMIVLSTLIVIPWKKFHGIEEIVSIERKKLKVITIFLIIINAIVFVVFLITTIIVQTTVENINEFKYAEGVSTDFYYSMLPFPPVLFNLAIILYYFSYFILPLHFYYLNKQKTWLSLICLVLSLNIVLYGLTFFSRAVVVQYALLYITMLFLVYGTLPKITRRVLNGSMISLGILAAVYFVSVSQKRFDEDKTVSQKYSKTMPVEAITQDPVTYSYIDYSSQGFLNGYEILQMYEGVGFDGKLTFSNLLSLFWTPMQSYEMLKLRTKLWPYEYSYTFNGFAAYSVYDYGVIGSLIFCLIYFWLVWKMSPVQGAIQLSDMFLMVLLLQIPLMAIFYSQMGGIFIAFLLWIPLWFYLKVKIRK